MKSNQITSKLKVLFFATRPKFFTASVAPVFVGSAMGYEATGVFEPAVFVLAVLAIMALHAGANMTNDYFDHVSGNDWAHKFPTAFSGGRRFIQKEILSAKATLAAALTAFAIGSVIGVVIVLLTGSIFIFLLGVVGLLGGYFYTATPVRLGYRCMGEFVIALLFGLLPVYGSYYLQTKSFDAVVLLPGCLVGTLIFLVILINEFGDAAADAAVNKRTLVVCFGVQISISVYRKLRCCACCDIRFSDYAFCRGALSFDGAACFLCDKNRKQGKFDNARP
jgi:1,4-dihydroxy-2-naphthoate octaprenyltransferase